MLTWYIEFGTVTEFKLDGEWKRQKRRQIFNHILQRSNHKLRKCGNKTFFCLLFCRAEYRLRNSFHKPRFVHNFGCMNFKNIQHYTFFLLCSCFDNVFHPIHPTILGTAQSHFIWPTAFTCWIKNRWTGTLLYFSCSEFVPVPFLISI